MAKSFCSQESSDTEHKPQLQSLTKMNAINSRIDSNITALLSKHGLTLKARKPSGAFADHVTVNECGAEFCVGSNDVTVFHPEGGWMSVSDFTTSEILELN